MLKNKAFVKILVSVCLSVTMIGALCLPLFAAMPHTVTYTDTATNLKYTKSLDGTVWSDMSGYVTASTEAELYSSEDIIYYPYVYVTVLAQGKMHTSNSSVFQSNASSELVPITEKPSAFVGPTMIPSGGVDYVYTEHSVHGRYFTTNEYSISQIWTDTIVSDISDFY